MDTHRPWYREWYVWMLILIPAAAFVGGLITLVLAVNGADVELPRAHEFKIIH